MLSGVISAPHLTSSQASTWVKPPQVGHVPLPYSSVVRAPGIDLGGLGFNSLSGHITFNNEIMGMSTMGHQLITGTWDKQVQVWSVDAKCTLCTVFSVELPTTVPQAVYFQGADILVFGMFDREM